MRRLLRIFCERRLERPGSHPHLQRFSLYRTGACSRLASASCPEVIRRLAEPHREGRSRGLAQRKRRLRPPRSFAAVSPAGGSGARLDPDARQTRSWFLGRFEPCPTPANPDANAQRAGRIRLSSRTGCAVLSDEHSGMLVSSAHRSAISRKAPAESDSDCISFHLVAQCFRNPANLVRFPLKVQPPLSESVTLGITPVTPVTHKFRFLGTLPTHTPTTVHIVDFSKSLVSGG